MKLTDQACKNAKAADKIRKLTDGGGLYLEVTTQGSKLWRMKYHYLGKEKKLSIGPYPLITLAEARQKRDEAKRLLLNNIDPSQAKKSAKESLKLEYENTFEVIAREWYNFKKQEWSERNAQEVLQRLERNIFPVIGKRPVKELTPKSILELANNIRERGASELAKRTVQMCNHIFQYAVLTERAERNIAADLRGMIKAPTSKPHAAIESNEIPQLLYDLHEAKLNRQTYLALRFMMLTFVRTSELIKAEWSEINFESRQWLLPASRMKMKKEHLVPLSNQSIEILKELRDLHTHPRYIFPSRHRRNQCMSNNTLLMALDRMGYRGKMTGHGFRALAMSTIMEKLGYRHEIPDIQLAHAKRGDVARAYDRAKFLPDRKKMMQEWSDYLDKLFDEKAAAIKNSKQTR